MTARRAPEPYDNLDALMRAIGDVDQSRRPRAEPVAPPTATVLCLFCELPYSRLRETENVAVIVGGVVRMTHDRCFTTRLGDIYAEQSRRTLTACCLRCGRGARAGHTMVSGEAVPEWDGIYCADGGRFIAAPETKDEPQVAAEAA